MKIEISRVSAWLFVVMVPINFVTILKDGVDTPTALAVFSLSMFYLLVAAPIVAVWWKEFNVELKVGRRVEWTDTEGVVRQGKIVGQHGENWLVHWDDYAVGVVDPKELRKVGK